jgi:diaminopimelate epimerase
LETFTYSGSGNTFTLIDNRKGLFFPEKKSLQELSSGKDGVVLLENSLKADIKMRIFNCDGSEAEMCGNGARCLLTFFRNLTGRLGNVTLETKASLLSSRIEKEGVVLFSPPPKNVSKKKIKDHLFYFLNTGVPHAVFVIDDLENHPLIEKGHELRHHPIFGKKGSNINFLKILDNALKLRTFERGLEHESEACGTGALAAAFIAITEFDKSSPLEVIPKSCDPLIVRYKKEIGFELQGNVYFT